MRPVYRPASQGWRRWSPILFEGVCPARTRHMEATDCSSCHSPYKTRVGFAASDKIVYQARSSEANIDISTAVIPVPPSYKKNLNSSRTGATGATGNSTAVWSWRTSDSASPAVGEGESTSASAVTFSFSSSPLVWCLLLAGVTAPTIYIVS